MTDNTQITLAQRPTATPTADNFNVSKAPMPHIADGQVLCQNIYLSLDPYMRSQIAGRHITGALNQGDVMLGETVSEVMESNHPDYNVGDTILTQGGWQSYTALTPNGARPLDPRINPVSLGLGVLGMPGLTAYAGLKYLGEPKSGDTVVVSAASGAVGSMVGQYAKSLGCRVIGIAGADHKCAWLRDVAGFDDCINYKTESVADGLDRICPDGVDVYFDNVGGDTLNAVMWRLAIGARVVLCGLMSQLNSVDRPSGPNPATIIKARATVRGLVVFDHWSKMGEMLDTFIPLIAAGKLQYKEDVSEGLDQAPAAFARLMTGQNFGKTIIKI